MRIATTPGGGQSKWQRRNTTTLSVMTSFEVDGEGIEGDGVVVGREETEIFELVADSDSVGGVGRIWQRWMEAVVVVVGGRADDGNGRGGVTG